MEEILTFLIFIMGLITVFLSLVVASSFSKYKKNLTGRPKRLSSSISYQLIGEAIIGSGTLLFAAAAHYGWLEDLGGNTQSAIRFIMFFATSATTLHLWRTLKTIESSLHKDE
jgi:hypothetical protein